MKSCKELKRLSRVTLMGNYRKLMGALIVATFLPLLVELPFSTLNSDYASNSQKAIFWVAEIFIQIIAGLLNLGYTTIFFSMARKQDFSPRQIYYCFRNRSDHFILGYAGMLLINLLAGIPALLGYILIKDYSNPLNIIALIGLGAVSLLLLLLIQLFYGMVGYLLLERNELKFYQCFGESRRILKGHRGQLFYLYLSFIGLTILEILSVGIGALYVEPYKNMTFVNFYIAISESNSSFEAAV